MLVIETFKGKAVNEHKVEIVERKGLGHPDYMCDSIMEAISVAIAEEYMKELGTIPHYNIDKGLLAAGIVRKSFGGGKLIKPMELTIGDRATFSLAGKNIPIAEIAVDAARKWIKRNLRFVDPVRHMKCRMVLAPGSEELVDIFLRPGETRAANDTSAAIGYYPLSLTEKVVLELEKYLNSRNFKDKYAETGEDIKIMGLRRKNSLSLTVAMPMLAKYIKSEEDYFDKKEAVLDQINKFLARYEGFEEVDVCLNALDIRGRGFGGLYLSLLGTSAEDADSGQVGRGNRVNGLISMNRPMGTEAAAGKNPVSHVGKIYNVLAHKIAREIYEGVEGIKEVYVLLLSRIGSRIDNPLMANAQMLLHKGKKIPDVSREIQLIFEKNFSEINGFCSDLARGKFAVC